LGGNSGKLEGDLELEKLVEFWFRTLAQKGIFMKIIF
jgi:hypothetical protein